MQASATHRIKSHSRRAALVAAAPLLLACAARSQFPAQPLRPPVPAQPLPPAQPTQISPATSVQPAAAPAPRTYRAEVEFANNQLTVAAENSSLDEILGEIAKLTGMKITGGVTDERVFGKYGPDSAQAVLNELLDGTGANVLLLETAQHTLAELVLSPRNGGPTPPSPNASREEDRNEENLPPGLAGRRREFSPGGRRGRIDGPMQENRQFEQPQPGQQPMNNETPAPQQPDASQQSPNGVKTPQQIYEDLVKQQAQPQQTPSTPPQ